MVPRKKQKLAFVVAASLSLSGCQHWSQLAVPSQNTANHSDSSEVIQTTATSDELNAVIFIPPFVRIVGESAPPVSYSELELLTVELHSELTFRGGVRLESSALVARSPAEICGAYSLREDELHQARIDGHEMKREDGAKGDAKSMPNINAISAQQIDDSGLDDEPLDLADTSGTRSSGDIDVQADSKFEVAVIVNDFTPYRPMQLAATFIIRDLSSGEELHRIQRVWRGITHEPDFEVVRKQLNSDLRHPVTHQRLEHSALFDISPRHLIKRAATEVADSLYQFLLQPQ